MKKTIMTDDERIAHIERWNRGEYRGVILEPVYVSMEFLLRVIRDQRAELMQVRQAITNMRKHFDGK